MPSPQRVVIYYHSLRPRAVRRAHRYSSYFLQQLPHQQVLLIASSASRAQDIQQLRQRCVGADELVVIGGDGSINLAAQVLVGTTIRLTVIATGTGNDFARDLGLGNWRWRMQSPVKLDTIAVGKAGDEYFINHIGSGLSVDLIDLQPSWLKQSFGRLSYSLALLRYLFGPLAARSGIYRQQQWDDCQIAAVSRFIGGGIPVNPQGSRHSGGLCWLAVPRASRWQQCQALWSVLRQRTDDCEWLLSRRLEAIEFGSADARYELDGDQRGFGPVTVTWQPAALTILRPLVETAT